jgi:hypothetical protein
MSLAHKGMKHSKEITEMIAAKNRGQKRSEETRRRMSEARHRFYASLSPEQYRDYMDARAETRRKTLEKE